MVDALEAAGGARPGVARSARSTWPGCWPTASRSWSGRREPPGWPPRPRRRPAWPAAGGATPLVNLNSATQAELEELPGVGPVTAQSILTFRTENGAFTAVDELLEVSGIGDATLAEIAPFVTL